MCWLFQSAQFWSYPTFLLVPLMVVGGIECFFGYRAWRFLLGVNGAVVGIVAGAMLCMLLGAPLFILGGALGGGVAGAALFAKVRPLGTFIFAFGSTASLAMLLAHLVTAPPRVIVPLGLAAGLTGAAAALGGCRTFMISIAAIAGAQQIASAGRAYQLPRGSLPAPDFVTPSESMAFIGLACAGLLLQFVQLALFSKAMEAKSREKNAAPVVPTTT